MPTRPTPEPSPRNQPTRRLTRQEWEDRRKKGLCFTCGQKFSPQHRCPEGSLRVLLLADDEIVDEHGNIVPPSVDSPPVDDEITGECLSLDCCGISQANVEPYKTLKFAGRLEELPIIILVDSGASHNFLSRELATALGLSISSIPELGIRLGDGTRIGISEQCNDVKIRIGNRPFAITALVYPLGSLDMILGVVWLSSLGDVTFNWKTHQMSFLLDSTRITLVGVSPATAAQPSLQSCLAIDSEPADQPPVSYDQLSACQNSQLTDLLHKFANLFQEPRGLPPARSVEHAINLFEGQGPVCVRPYRYPHLHKNEIQRQIEDMSQQGIIRPSRSAFSSPVILVKKKDSSWRLCIDYRSLNKATIPDKYPIPVVEELLDELYGSKYFSKIDLKSGFYQVRVRDTDIEKTAFRTHNGHYEFLVMPFGLTNAPATFQALMNDVFRPHLRSGVLVFFDDILVYSPTWSHHVELLSKVLLTLAAHNLFANHKKCSFGQRSIVYLGHIVDAQGVSMDPSKLQAIRSWPIPKSVKAVRGFLGLTGYYRKFIRGYGKIARPLTDLTKRDAFKWNTEAQLAFDELKEVMTSAPVLALPDFSQPFEIECDASGRGVGAVLMQSRRPLAFFSKALSDRNLSKSAYEKEVMALVLAIQHWRPYLLGRQFTVFTDQKSLRHLLDQRVITVDQQNWVAKLLGFQFTICYKPGRDNRAADALSRLPDEGELNTIISFPVWADGTNLQQGIEADSRLQQIITDIISKPHLHPNFSLQGGKLYHKGRLVIPSGSPWIARLIAEFHDSPSGGHSGFYRTYRRMAAHFYWLGMPSTIKAFVRECPECQRYKTSTLSPAGLLQPLPIPDRIWDDISMDFISGLPKSKGYEAIFVVVDRLSKYSHFIPLKHPYTARSLAEIFLREVVRLHGIPRSVVSDRDPIFLSNFWKEIFSLQGSKLHYSSAYHPESDGQTEVTNRSLETYLRCFASEQPKTWSTWLSWAEYWHNTTFNISIQSTPFAVVYGRPPPSILRFVPGEVHCEAVAQDLMDRDEALRQLKYHLSRAQERMKKAADKHRRDIEFAVGDWVFLKLRPHRQHSAVKRINQKLSARFYGPFMILDRVGQVAYKLQLPSSSKIHPVFHVSLLKKAVGNHSVEASLPPGLEVEDNHSTCPDKCLATRELSENGKTSQQWLIQWKGGSAEDATWEDSFLIQSQHPQFRLEDKPIVQDAGIDSSSVPPAAPKENKGLLVYSRRRK